MTKNKIEITIDEMVDKVLENIEPIYITYFINSLLEKSKKEKILVNDEKSVDSKDWSLFESYEEAEEILSKLPKPKKIDFGPKPKKDCD